MGWGTHAICGPCYARIETEREPVREKDAGIHPCCFCGKDTGEGIYYRAKDEDVPHCTGHEG